MKKIILLLLIFLIINPLYSYDKEKWLKIIGSAFLENKSYDFLEKICDDAGGRLAGTENNFKSIKILTSELKKLGIEAREEKIEFPGWVRGDDSVVMLLPSYKKLRAIALGYVNSTAPFPAELIDLGAGYDENYENKDAKSKIVLISRESENGKEQPLRLECIEIAAKHGAKGILFTNSKIGGLLLAGVADFKGLPSAIPAFSISYEEGNRLHRLLEKKEPVLIQLSVDSYCQMTKSSNVVAAFPGKSQKKIVIGAHFDSWDMGQGSIDNGTGSAVLFDIARLLKNYSPANYYSIELVWFNGEELGLWGSRKYMEMHDNDSIIAMLNMDMQGLPLGFNSCGFDEFKPFLDSLSENLKCFDLKNGVKSEPWANSDQQYFFMNGIPSFTFDGLLDKDMYWYYHDFSDTFDKVSRFYLSDAAAIATIFALELANDSNLKFNKLTSDETIQMLKKHNLDKRLKREGLWFYKEN